MSNRFSLFLLHPPGPVLDRLGQVRRADILCPRQAGRLAVAFANQLVVAIKSKEQRLRSPPA